MILIKYILKEIFKNQLIILVLLFLVCVCQKLIKMLGLDNNIPIYLIFIYLILNIPELGKLIIPFSLFLSVIITCYRLHTYNEILAMYSCGINKYFFIQSILLYSTIISFLVMINIFWLSPYCEQYRNSMLFEVKKNTHFNDLISKKFQLLYNKQLMLFIDNVKNKKLQNVFIVQKKQDSSQDILSIIIADQGSVCNYTSDDYQSIIFNKGMYYEIHNNQKIYTNIYITNFYQHKILINNDIKSSKINNNIIDHMFINQIWHSSLPEAYIELHWRLTLLVSIFIMPMIGLLLMINISHNYLINFLLAMILYIIFFILHILLRSYSISVLVNPIIWMWLTNLVYFIIVIFINLRKSFLRIFFKLFFHIHLQ